MKELKPGFSAKHFVRKFFGYFHGFFFLPYAFYVLVKCWSCIRGMTEKEMDLFFLSNISIGANISFYSSMIL